MSSIIDSNISDSISNRKIIAVSFNLTSSNERTVDLTNCSSDGVYGNLDFEPDYVILRNIMFSSKNNNPGDSLPIVFSDCVDNYFMGAFQARNSNTEYSLKYKCRFSKDIRNVKFWHEGLTNSTTGTFYTTGTIIVIMEFIRYQRYTD